VHAMHVASSYGLILLFGANASSLIIMTPYPPWGVLSTTFLIIGSYSLIIGLNSAGLYIATDSSLRRITARSPQKDYDILKSLGHVKTQDIVTNKIDNISKQVYNEIQSDNLFTIASEPANVLEYINEALKEISMIDPNALRKSKDRASAKDLR
jgi:hypothetical protein